jgi:hypothetical protein
MNKTIQWTGTNYGGGSWLASISSSLVRPMTQGPSTPAVSSGAAASIPRREAVTVPTTAYPIESYTAERLAEFILSSAVDPDDYMQALAEVRRMGLDPNTILHCKPPGA